MKGYLEKQLGIKKAEHVNPKAPGITYPSTDQLPLSASACPTSWFGGQWTLIITPLATAAAVQSLGSRQYKDQPVCQVSGLVLSKSRLAITATSFLTVQ